MKTLHIVQGGVKNGDMRRLERITGTEARIRTWIAPKSAGAGDEVVIFIGGYGFFATGRVASASRARPDWGKRAYGVALDLIRLIEPAISLAAIRRAIPNLTWANYPRSVTTPPPEVAEEVRDLVDSRRKTGRLDDFDDDSPSALEGVLQEKMSYMRSRSRKLRDAALASRVVSAKPARYRSRDFSTEWVFECFRFTTASRWRSWIAPRSTDSPT